MEINKKFLLVISCMLKLTSCCLYNKGANQIIKASDEILEDELKANGSLCGLAFKAFDENSDIVQTYQFQELNEEDSNPIENLPDFISFLDVSDS